MKNAYPAPGPLACRPLLFLLTLLLLAGIGPAAAQAPAWDAALTGNPNQPSGTTQVVATAANAAGEVLVAGSFTGAVAFGSTLLTSAGSNDLFVAKYLPASGSWAWAYRGGGLGDDQALGLAVSGTAVYVTGFLTNSLSNVNAATLGDNRPATSPAATVRGTSALATADLLLARYTDNGPDASLAWVQVGGGGSSDRGNAVAVSGTAVYVTGSIINTLNDGNTVRLGSDGTTSTTTGLTTVRGTSTNSNADLLLARYTDNTTSATLAWAQVGGGSGPDQGQAVAVSGTAVYVTGALSNTLNDNNTGRFGSNGTASTTTGLTTVRGTSASSSNDVLLARYTDNTTSATLAWVQVGGGSGSDQGLGVAVSGSTVYVTGSLSNNLNDSFSGRFGSDGTTSTTTGLTTVRGTSTNPASDVLLARYTDNTTSATYNWAQVGGGTGGDQGTAVAVSGSTVYVTGNLFNSLTDGSIVRFGSNGTATTNAGLTAVPGIGNSSTQDVLLARYTDTDASTGTFDWVQVGGGTGQDLGRGLALAGSTLYVGGYVGLSNSVSFGAATGSPLLGTIGNRAVLAAATDAGPSGSWTRLDAAFNGGLSQVQATAPNGAGDVLVAGYFSGQVYVGSTLLTSVGGADLFVAKYRPATGSWAWAYRGGGSSTDQAQALAVSGNAVYVTGYISNNLSNAGAVALGDNRPAATPPAAVNGTSSTLGQDVLLVRYTDNGPDASLNWVQVGGGISGEQGNAVAVSGTAVYVTGTVYNNLGDTNAARFGSDGTATTTAGLTQVRGTSSSISGDVLLARYTDNLTSASLNWVQVGGGTSNDTGVGVAVSGTAVYVTGALTNSLSDGATARFGSDGTAPDLSTLTPVRGTGANLSADVLLARYTDNTTSATLNWTQVGGGINTDVGFGVAVSGSAVYVTGTLNNSLNDGATARFGSDGTASTTAGLTQVRGTSSSITTDVLLAKYTDNTSSATLNWVQVGGGTSNDQGTAVAVSGSQVYVAGFLINTQADGNVARFGSNGTATTNAGLTAVPGASSAQTQDVLLTRYTDNGATATFDWAQVGGGTGQDVGTSVAVRGQQVYVGGYVVPAATFGSTTIAQPVGGQSLLLARLTDASLPPLPAPLPVQLTAFTAALAGPAAVRLAWATASEQHSARFEVERSADGRTFAPIGTVAAAGNSNVARAYALTDARLPAGAATLYYRLRQVDADDAFSYSPVRTVVLTGAAAGLTLYPNPARSGAATLTGAQPGTAVTVTDALGRPVAAATADATGTTALALPAGLPAGVYVVRAGTRAVRLTLE